MWQYAQLNEVIWNKKYLEKEFAISYYSLRYSLNMCKLPRLRKDKAFEKLRYLVKKVNKLGKYEFIT